MLFGSNKAFSWQKDEYLIASTSTKYEKTAC